MTKPKDDAAPAKASTPSERSTPMPDAAPRKCGLVMPISAMDGILASHWAEVKSIITDAVLPDWDLVMVSDGDDAVIHRRIVERLYSDELVIVDLSAKNPNVMLELGMRLAFDKRTVIVKDDQTLYPFDMAPNEYVEYPRDLRFQRIVDFKKKLRERVDATMKPGHTTYLKSFGTFKVAKIETEVVSSDQMILEKLGRLETLLARSAAREAQVSNSVYTTGPFVGQTVQFGTGKPTWDQFKEVRVQLLGLGVQPSATRKIAEQFLEEFGPHFNAEILRPWCVKEGYLSE